jgi:cytochrome c biogenesis protein CcmG/thiol:disulfide interchange protein DsbE
MNALKTEPMGILAAGRTRFGTLLVMALAAALILVVAYAVNQPAGASGVTAISVSAVAGGDAPEVGKTAPDFQARLVDGTPVSLASLRGTPVWLTFGASWCQPCRAENADVEATAVKYQGRVQVVQVYISEDAATVADYAKRVGLTYSTVVDPSTTLAAEYRILGIPSHFFIDASGVLKELRVGSLDPASMEAALTAVVR